MPREKRHYRRSRIPESKFCGLVRYFAEDLSATDVAWNVAQHRLQKFNGVPNRTFYLHMKESKWRFNHSDTELYRELLK